jgi:hypothetical protein
MASPAAQALLDNMTAATPALNILTRRFIMNLLARVCFAGLAEAPSVTAGPRRSHDPRKVSRNYREAPDYVYFTRAIRQPGA